MCVQCSAHLRPHCRPSTPPLTLQGRRLCRNQRSSPNRHWESPAGRLERWNFPRRAAVTSPKLWMKPCGNNFFSRYLLPTASPSPPPSPVRAPFLITHQPCRADIPLRRTSAGCQLPVHSPPPPLLLSLFDVNSPQICIPGVRHSRVTERFLSSSVVPPVMNSPVRKAADLSGTNFRRDATSLLSAGGG